MGVANQFNRLVQFPKGSIGQSMAADAEANCGRTILRLGYERCGFFSTRTPSPMLRSHHKAPFHSIELQYGAQGQIPALISSSYTAITRYLLGIRLANTCPHLTLQSPRLLILRTGSLVSQFRSIVSGVSPCSESKYIKPASVIRVHQMV